MQSLHICLFNLEGNFASKLQISHVVCFALHFSISLGSEKVVLQMLQVLCFLVMWFSRARLLPKGCSQNWQTLPFCLSSRVKFCPSFTKMWSSPLCLATMWILRLPSFWKRLPHLSQQYSEGALTSFSSALSSLNFEKLMLLWWFRSASLKSSRRSGSTLSNPLML